MDTTLLPRPISPGELDTIRAAIEYASVEPINQRVLDSLHGLQVVGLCGCGCASVDFAASEITQSRIVADATGITSQDKMVGILVWGNSEAITGLEIYGLDSSDCDSILPVPGTLRPLGSR